MSLQFVENGVWDTTTQCVEIDCPYDPLVSGGFDAASTSCEGYAGWFDLDVACSSGYV